VNIPVHIARETKLARNIVTCLLLYLSICLLPEGDAQALVDADLKKITFEQKLNQKVSRGLHFLDEDGHDVKLGDYFGKRPVILVLGYYGCPMLCTLVFNGMVEGLQDLKAGIGDEFEVVHVSIDPHETPALAAAKKKTYLRRYGRAGAATGWHFLTGDKASIQQLANEVGFHYAYDEKSRQYAHPSGLIILTPEGKISHYLFGVNYSGEEINSAIKVASAGRVGSPVEQVLLLCFHYSPMTGKYATAVMIAVRIGAAATVLLLARWIIVAIRKDGIKRGRNALSTAKTG
jgi:protein SCO1